MLFHHPGWLLGLLLVAAVAAWALFRPSRRLAVVGSLSLWQKALDALDRSARRSSRRVTASWALLLAGTAAAVVGLARPGWYAEAPGRRVAVGVYASAELDRRELVGTAAALLDRLGAADRVQLLRPMMLGGAGTYLRPDEARRALATVPLLPVRAEELAMPAPDPDVQHTYLFVAAGTGVQGGPRISVIELPGRLPAVTFDAVGAAPLPGGSVQLFLALRNQRSRMQRTWVRAEAPGAGGAAPWRELARWPVEVQPGARFELVRELPAVAALGLSVDVDAPSPLATAFLARTSARRRAVAIVGSDEPVLRRFIQADETLVQVAEARDADLVFANRAAPPAGKPALVIDPPTDPPGWRRGETRRAVVLAGADVAADDPVMRRVDLAATAVWRVRPWMRTGSTPLKVLVSDGSEAFILRNEPGELAPARAPRVYVAFELSADNTDLAMSETLVVFLANAVRWLAPPGRAEATYDYLPPRRAPRDARWRRLAGGGGRGAGLGPLPWPGVFRDDGGALRAVSLVGLGAGRPKQPPADAVAAAPLPAAELIGHVVELWPLLVAAAVTLWLAGWAMRLR